MAKLTVTPVSWGQDQSPQDLVCPFACALLRKRSCSTLPPALARHNHSLYIRVQRGGLLRCNRELKVFVMAPGRGFKPHAAGIRRTPRPGRDSERIVRDLRDAGEAPPPVRNAVPLWRGAVEACPCRSDSNPHGRASLYYGIDRDKVLVSDRIYAPRVHR